MTNDIIKDIEGQLLLVELQPGFSGFDFSFRSRPIGSKGGRAEHTGRVANTKLLIQDLTGRDVIDLVVKQHQLIN